MEDINFFKPYKALKEKQNFKKCLSWIVGILCLGMMGITPIANIFKIHNLTKQAENVHTCLNTFTTNSKIKTLDQYHKDLETIKTQYDQLTQLEKAIQNKDTVNDLLIDTIKKLVPENIYFKYIRVTSKNVQILGMADNEIAIAQFQYQLDRIEDFHNFHLQNVSFKDGVYDFSLAFEIEDVISNEICP